MTSTLDYYYDVGSPNCYLAHVRLPEILARTGAALSLKIMLLGGVFQATGNRSPIENKLKAPNSARDMMRFIGKYRVPFKMNPYFPINTLKMMRGAVVAEAENYLDRYNEAVYPAMWRDGLDMGKDEVLIGVLEQAGLDGRRIVARTGEDQIKATLKANTEAAVARGVFGAPTFFVGDEMFFGQDRLDFVEDALQGRSWLPSPSVAPSNRRFPSEEPA
jgi:2-hydroxychromene-2-carboxylate isomerase